jgi:hypothetical protein
MKTTIDSYQNMKGKHYSNGNRTRGIFHVPYYLLVKAFGVPSKITVSKGKATDAEWTTTTENGSTVSLYNYKNGNNYLGTEGTPTHEIAEWHLSAPLDDYYWEIKCFLEQFEQVGIST